MEPAFPSVIPVHGRVGVGASLVHSMVISVLHSFLGLSSVLSTLTKEHSREGQGVQSYEPNYKEFSGGFLGYLSLPDHRKLQQQCSQGQSPGMQKLDSLCITNSI